VLSVTGRIAPHLLDAQQRFIQYLVKSGRLNRDIEFLPSDEELAERRTAGQGLAAPERAVLFAYAKIWLYDELVASKLPDDPWVASALARYFPHTLSERYVGYLARHPLKREIIATHVTNSMLNRVGSTFVHRLGEATGAQPPEVVRAYLLSREVFGFVSLWKQIEALDNEVDDALQAAMLIDMSRELERGTTWFLRSRRLGDEMGTTIAYFTPRIAAVAARLPQLIDAEDRALLAARVAEYTAQRVPPDVAESVAEVPLLYAALDIVEVAGTTKHAVEDVAAAHFEVAAKLDLPWLAARITALPGGAHWQTLARAAMQDDLSTLQRTVTAAVLGVDAPSAAAPALFETWSARNARALARVRQLIGELKAGSSTDAAMLSVALRELRNLV
jgi:glutamate dehydrogenase